MPAGTRTHADILLLSFLFLPCKSFVLLRGFSCVFFYNATSSSSADLNGRQLRALKETAFLLHDPHALITASCVFKPLKALNLKEQQLYTAVIDRRERQVFAALEAPASKVSAQLGPGHTSLTLTLSLSFSPSLMSSSCEIRGS